MGLFWLLLGLVALTVGAELLVRGASRLAKAVGLPPLVIGLTIVAFGTSAPELAVSLKAGVAGQADIALGNVLGSNTFNVLFIMGISALIAPLAVSAQLVRLDVPVMIGVSGLVWIWALDRTISRLEGALLVILLLVYTTLLIYLASRHRQAVPAVMGAEAHPASPAPRGLAFSALLVAIGLGLLIVGSGWLVNGAVTLARLLGISELVIGLTIVAAGTSMPEAATSILAALRGERDISVGNVVGSNIFNLLGVLGCSAWVSGEGVSVAEAALRFDIPVMVAVAVACLPVFLTAGRISRWEGGVFLAYYAVYLAFLVLSTTRHALAAPFTAAMLWFVLPLTALGLIASVAVWLRQRDTRPS